MGTHPSFGVTGALAGYQPKTTDESDSSVAGTVVPHVNAQSFDGAMVTIGAQADAAATSDSGTFSLMAFVKRGLANWTALLARLPALVSGRIPVDGSGVTQPVSFLSQPLPTGASTAAKQPALGTAGTPSADVISVQGIANGTPQAADTVIKATATARGGLTTVKAASAAVSAGGSGYAVNDTITNAAGTFTVSAVTTGAVTAVTVTTATALTAIPSSPLAQSATSGSGTGCTLTPTYVAAAVQLAAANTARRGLSIQNQSTSPLWFSGTSGATPDYNSFLLNPGDYFETSPHHVGTGAISIIGTTAGQAFYAREF